jgi:hypothetical protein
MRAWGFLKNRVMVASLGAALIFGGSAVFAMTQLTQHAAPAGQASTASVATDTATTSADGTTSAGGSSSGSNSSASPTATTPPTATPIPPTATPRPQPTPTSVPPNQQIQVQGKVYSILSANSFTVQQGSRLYTIVINASTTITINGRTRSDLSNLQKGMDANIQGLGNPDGSGSILASTVDAQGDD